MLGASDLLRVMQTQGSIDNPPGIQLGTMTGYNTCMLGDELQLTEEQLYFFRRDTQRLARTVRPNSEIRMESEIGENLIIYPKLEEDEVDRVVYTRPYKEGDTVALIQISDGRYLVLGRVIPGEKVKEVDEQTRIDWEADDFPEDLDEEE